MAFDDQLRAARLMFLSEIQLFQRHPNPVRMIDSMNMMLRICRNAEQRVIDNNQITSILNSITVLRNSLVALKDRYITAGVSVESVNTLFANLSE